MLAVSGYGAAGAFEVQKMKKPKSVDIVVGKRVRLRRVAIKMSQQELAKSLHITFQQVQKYENGTNRISCSRLYDIARSLKTPISYFFADLSDKNPGPDHIFDEIPTGRIKDSAQLVHAFLGIPDKKIRRKAIEFLESLSRSAR
jgi:transcriptional regulator with XRE-family HTH domain